MSDNHEVEPGEVEESSEDLSELFYGSQSEPQEPADLAEDETEESQAEFEDEEEEEGGEEAQPEADLEEEDEEELVIDEDNKFVKYELDEESGLYSFKSNGSKVKVNIKELINNYQAGQKLTNELEKIAEERKGIYDPKRLEASAALEQEKSLYVDKLKRLESIIKDVDESTDWEELKELDPTEYLLRKEQQEERKKIMEAERSEAAKNLELRNAEVTQQEGQKLRNAVGSRWDDETAMNADFDKIRAYAASRGITQEELSQIRDHRFWLAMLDGADLAEIRNKKVKVKKAPPKTVKSKKRASPKPREEDKSDAEVFYGYK